MSSEHTRSSEQLAVSVSWIDSVGHQNSYSMRFWDHKRRLSPFHAVLTLHDLTRNVLKCIEGMNVIIEER